MSNLIQFLQRFGFVGESINEPDIPSSTYSSLPPRCFFITARILLCPFPSETIGPQLAEYLKGEHANKFMIWNLSEKTYDVSQFNNQVLDYIYLGYPNPPLESIFSVFTSLKGWLDTDTNNIAVVHCQLTQARSHMILACFLSWFSVHPKSPTQSLEEVCKISSMNPSVLFPSNKRYLNYIGSVIRGDKPPLKVLRIARVILNGIPQIEEEGPSVNIYFQLFKDSRLVLTSAPQECYAEEISVTTDIAVWMEGDVLIRCRHLTPTGNRLTLFKIMFNTSFVSGANLRFKKKEIDCACKDKRFPDDMFIDIFFDDFQQISEKQSKLFWASLESAKNREVKKTLLGDDEEEEEFDRGLIEKFKHLNDPEENLEEDDLDNYFEMLEKKNL